MPAQMKMERIVLIGILLVAGALVVIHGFAATRIYKTVDADGNVVFTDVPPRSDQIAEPVDVKSPNSYESEDAASPTPSRKPWIVEPDEAKDKAPAAPVYQSLTIRSPADDANIRQNAGNVEVVAALYPPLLSGHQLRLLLDGKPAGSPNGAMAFALSNVDRGTHTLTPQVVDGNGEVLFTGTPSVFHLQRYSALLAPNRPGSKKTNH